MARHLHSAPEAAPGSDVDVGTGRFLSSEGLRVPAADPPRSLLSDLSQTPQNQDPEQRGPGGRGRPSGSFRSGVLPGWCFLSPRHAWCYPGPLKVGGDKSRELCPGLWCRLSHLADWVSHEFWPFILNRRISPKHRATPASPPSSLAPALMPPRWQGAARPGHHTGQGGLQDGGHGPALRQLTEWLRPEVAAQPGWREAWAPPWPRPMELTCRGGWSQGHIYWRDSQSCVRETDGGEAG